MRIGKSLRNWRIPFIQGDSYLLQAELPGFDKSDINIDLKDSLLTAAVSGADGCV